MIDIEKGIMQIAEKYKNPAWDCYYYNRRAGDGYAKIDAEITAYLDDIGVISRIAVYDIPKDTSIMWVMWLEDNKIMPLPLNIMY